jgi:hypothetical protein
MGLECMPAHCFFSGTRILSGRGPLHYRGFTITLRHTTLFVNPLDEGSANRKDLYLKRQNIYKRQTAITPAGNSNKPAAADPRLKSRGRWVSGVLSEVFPGGVHRLGNHARSRSRNLRNKGRNASQPTATVGRRAPMEQTDKLFVKDV